MPLSLAIGMGLSDLGGDGADPNIIAELTIPDADFSEGAQSNPANGWVPDDDYGGAPVFPAEPDNTGIEVPQYTAIYTTVTGLATDTFYRVRLEVLSGSVSADNLRLGGGVCHRADYSGGIYDCWFLTPPTLIDSYLYILNTAPLDLDIERGLTVVEYSDAAELPDPNLVGEVVQIGGSGFPTWTAARAGEGAYDGLPTVGGGEINFCTGPDGSGDVTSGVESEEGTGRIVGGAPYRITWDSTVVGNASGIWQMEALGIASDEEMYQTASYEGYAGAGSTATPRVKFAREADSPVRTTVDVTGPLVLTRGAVPTPSIDITAGATEAGDDSGSGWTTSSYQVHGWLIGGGVVQAGCYFQISLDPDDLVRAWLAWDVDSVTAGAPFTIRGLKGTNAAWSNGNPPGVNTTQLITTYASVGPKVHDVTAILAECAADGVWTGTNDYFLIATGLIDGTVDCDMASDPRLIVVTGNGVFS